MGVPEGSGDNAVLQQDVERFLDEEVGVQDYEAKGEGEDVV